MANYRDIKGFQVESKSADPTTGITGDIYYNTATGEYKALTAGAGSWASVSAMNTARFGIADSGSSGTTTATLCMGGDVMPTEPRMVTNTEDWNGASWVEVADLSTARRNLDGRGTSTAGLATGGSNPPSTTLAATEEWSGSSNSTKTIDTD